MTIRAPPSSILLEDAVPFDFHAPSLLPDDRKEALTLNGIFSTKASITSQLKMTIFKDIMDKRLTMKV